MGEAQIEQLRKVDAYVQVTYSFGLVDRRVNLKGFEMMPTAWWSHAWILVPEVCALDGGPSLNSQWLSGGILVLDQNHHSMVLNAIRQGNYTLVNWSFQPPH